MLLDSMFRIFITMIALLVGITGFWMAWSRAIGKEIVALIINSHSSGLTGNLI